LETIFQNNNSSIFDVSDLEHLLKDCSGDLLKLEFKEEDVNRRKETHF